MSREILSRPLFQSSEALPLILKPSGKQMAATKHLLSYGKSLSKAYDKCLIQTKYKFSISLIHDTQGGGACFLFILRLKPDIISIRLLILLFFFCPVHPLKKKPCLILLLDSQTFPCVLLLPNILESIVFSL